MYILHKFKMWDFELHSQPTISSYPWDLFHAIIIPRQHQKLLQSVCFDVMEIRRELANICFNSSSSETEKPHKQFSPNISHSCHCALHKPNTTARAYDEFEGLLYAIRKLCRQYRLIFQLEINDTTRKTHVTNINCSATHFWLLHTYCGTLSAHADWYRCNFEEEGKNIQT